jgi:hypothetical protein
MQPGVVAAKAARSGKGEIFSEGMAKTVDRRGFFTHASKTARRPFDNASGKFYKWAGTNDVRRT